MLNVSDWTTNDVADWLYIVVTSHALLPSVLMCLMYCAAVV